MKMASEVLFTPFESTGKIDALNRRVSMMMHRVGFFDSLSAGDSVAVKVHPGEMNNITYLRPSLVRSVADQLLRRGAVPFVTETTTLYCRERFTPEELVSTAAWNGFTGETMGCPFVVADSGPDVVVNARGRRLDNVHVAAEIAGADALVVLTHLTGHPWTAGLAGSIKQLGMGCVGRQTKADIHLSTSITIDADLCNACGKCADVCKSEAVLLGEESAALTERCVRCGVCIGSCPKGAISYSHDFDWFARALAEAAAGVLSRFEPGRAVFVNFLTDITRCCDCEDFSGNPVFPDIGVVVSPDPVASDQASADLVNASTPLPGRADHPEVAGSTDKILAMTGIEWWKQLEHAESLGLGTRDYTLGKVKS
ncbi:MAG: DUF362 domain-containing protein [Actinobacteria bacterium]|nr:DUF362 domain-containing protein [Actinomycetota bacterium]MCG2796593.1 DUF362 domain-containing protein [Actinomycetes bacterium]MBU4241364.1 DUF362 domain-containing protein [Actinomycetota bacterium]MBU4302247.1 DUF362 domain-containing protein [Actinomycetota bacterium]MBU4386682.1 DUF362 domain-containing protein [Actinomycetota bacterium]